MLNQTINDNNESKINTNDTFKNDILSDEEYQHLIIISFIKNITSIFIFTFLLIIKYLKIYNYFLNEQNNQHIIIINCFSGGFLFYISFIYSTNRRIIINYLKDLSNLKYSNIDNLEIISFLFGFILIFFIKKILNNDSISFYIPLINPNEKPQIQENDNINNNIENIDNKAINNIKTSNNNIITEIKETGHLSFNNITDNVFKYNINSLYQKTQKNNIEMNILDKNEVELESKKEKNKKEHSFNIKNIHNNIHCNNNYIFNRPFKDADNDEETNEEFFYSTQENKRIIKKKSFHKNRKIPNNQIPTFNLNATKVKKNEKVKEDNIHRIGTKINKEVFDITYKNKQEIQNNTITINLCNKQLIILVIDVIIYNIYFLFLGILIGFLDLKGNILQFIFLVLLLSFRVTYEENNILYNYNLFKNEPAIQKMLLFIFDLIFPLGIFLGNIFINLYYKYNLAQYSNYIIVLKGLCCGNCFFCSIFLFYFEETKNNTDIQHKLLIFALGIIASFIILSINY